MVRIYTKSFFHQATFNILGLLELKWTHLQKSFGPNVQASYQQEE